MAKISDEERAVLDAWRNRRQSSGRPAQGGGVDWLSIVLILLAFVLVAILNITGVI